MNDHDHATDLGHRLAKHRDDDETGPRRTRRGSGHGRSDEPYDRILATARRLFATRGYDGTTTRDIAAKADVNLGAIRYYFTSKSGLYVKVLHQVLGPMAQRVRLESNRPIAPLRQLEGVVRALFEHIRANPDMPALMVREMAGGRDISPQIINTMQNVLPQLVGMVSAGQRDGSIRPGDPVLLSLSTLSQPVYLSLTRRALARVMGLDQNDPATYTRMVEHAVVTVRAALEQRHP